jgi:hypothetical protein
MTNEQAVMLAVFRLTGGLEPADTEDVAMEADRLAPDRFRWRKYQDQVNLQAVGKSLWYCKKRGLMRGDARVGWMLEQGGLDEAQRLNATLPSAPPRAPISARERAWRKSERIRLTSEPAFAKVAAGQVHDVSERELHSFFRLDEYVIGGARQDRVDRLSRAFSDDAVLAPIIARLLERLPL